MNDLNLPITPEPYWRATIDLPSFPPLTEDIHVDVAIIGGGISGITTAYLLAKKGVNVALIEANQLLNGTTGHTTAKITAQHDLIYDEFIQHFGEEKARLYYEANKEAIDWIKEIVTTEQIDCDFTVEDAYIYTTAETERSKIENEWEAYQKIGIDGEYVEKLPLPFSIQGAIMMRNQAQFHPLKYLRQLVQFAVRHGASFYEHTVASDIEAGTKPRIKTKDGHLITCDAVIVCSHFPFYDGALYFSRLYAERSYVLAIKTEKDYPGGMYLSAGNPKRSLRYTMMNGEKLVLVGGESHKTGQGIATMKHYEVLQSFAEHTFGIQEILYRWSAQDLVTLDRIPYIGSMRTDYPNIMVATGYRKWGMTSGTLAAHLLSDLAMQKENRYREVFTPSRFYADPSVKNFLKENVDVAKHLISGKLEYALRQPEDLVNGEGAVVNVNGKRCGAYRDEGGNLHIVDTTCTHMGCELEWNNGDRTWDCPCHGSRFSIDGEVMEGPAQRRLEKK
ncbi:FAD-dependent oxidoreductase [Thermolongibacillus altinsuensis]|uniref:FAD-dependent oxidoreductase n=1 Tax=Thermolongibacillus altinsuensis TaxID=575256 RepID=UPI00242A2AD5|nr:FAD-dependent oxidoreductase [Thermolongibacillus altinsuensis]GMB09804.1 (2Fe-2S)-binding protein [Thermolongibacillus altinsuensis]